MLLCCQCLVVWCMAQTILADEAYAKAKSFMNTRGKQVSKLQVKTIKMEGQTEPACYVYNTPAGDGFVIVSGDRRIDGVIGYSDNGSFDGQSMPENMRAWLQDYAREITALRQGLASPRRVPTHAAISPLVASKWDQGTASEDGDAYNQLCPTIGGVHCMTGCVATAMAQIMRYNRWPTGYTEVIPAYKSNDKLGTLSALSAVKFNWNQMQDKYRGTETSTQRTAVARLMRYCGQALEMDYGTKSSSTTSDKVAMALRTYFGYDTNTRHVVRSDYTAEGWDKLIYNELKENRPVYYHGSSTGGGHGFVCDGYDGNGLYHINWGWEGKHDGYYRLSLLNPDGGGTGSSGTEDGYTMSQGAVVGIRQPVSFDDDMRILSLDELNTNGSTIEAAYWNRTGMDGTFQYGFAYQEINTDGDSFWLDYKTNSFNPGTIRRHSVDVNTMDLGSGTYRFYPFSRLEGADWYRMQGDFGTYIEVVMKNGVKQSMSYHPHASLTVSHECVGNRIVNMPQEVKISVTNKGEEFNDLFYLFASKTNQKGEYVNQTNMVVEAGATEQGSMFFTPTSTGTWKLWIDIDEEGSHDLSPITVEIISAPTGTNNLSLVSYTVDVVGDGVNVQAKVKNNASQGYYRPVGCAIFTEDSNTSIVLQESGNLNLAAGKTVTLDYHFEGLLPGKQHYAMVAQYKKHSDTSLSVFGSRMWFIPTVTGIEAVPVDNAASDDTWENPSDVYTITGTLIRPQATTLKGLPRGVYVVNGSKRVVGD